MKDSEKKLAPADADLLEMLAGGALSYEQEIAAVEEWGRRNTAGLLPLALFCLAQKARLKEELNEAVGSLAELRGKMSEAPWHPARFVGPVHGAEGRALVAIGGRRFAVGLAPGIDIACLERGADVYLNAPMSLLLAPAPDLKNPGPVGIFSRRHNGRAVLRGPAGEEVVVDLGKGLEEGLESGTLLLYDRENMFACERVEAPPQDEGLLVDVPADVTIDRLGGLREVFDEIVGEIALHLAHRDLVVEHELDAVKGILLKGPPGCGKTSLVRALAAHLRSGLGLNARILLARAGVHRDPYYGVSEQRIRRIFAAAKAAAGRDGYVILFLDDCDQIGSREDSTVSAIDTRLVPAFLQEIEGIRSVDRLMLVAATNRADLLDEALVRPGRIDRVFSIPRPGRSAAREIFRKYLSPGLPYRVDGIPDADAAEVLTERALSALYSENGEFHVLGHLVLRDASRQPVTAPQVLSGALIRNTLAAAKRSSCLRVLRGGQRGLGAADVFDALGHELNTIARGLRPGPALRQLLQIPTDLDVVKVELPAADATPGRYRYMRLG